MMEPRHPVSVHSLSILTYVSNQSIIQPKLVKTDLYNAMLEPQLELLARYFIMRAFSDQVGPGRVTGQKFRLGSISGAICCQLLTR